MKKFWLMNKHSIIKILKIVLISLAVNLVLILFWGLCFLALINGSGVYLGDYPYQGNYTWVSDSPAFLIEYRRSLSLGGEENAYIIIDGEEFPVHVQYYEKSFHVYPADQREYDKRLLYGTWKYKDKKSKLVFIIEEDYIFDSQYEKIVFTRQETQ